MELEEMKSAWLEMSAQIEKQKKLTDTLIIKMVQIRYTEKLNQIFVPEVIGSSVCFLATLFIIINFYRLDTWYMSLCGIVSILILLLLSILSVRAIYRVKSINISGSNYQETLIKYANDKLQFVFIQKLNFYLSAVLLITILPVMVELLGGKNPFHKTGIWYMYAIGYPSFYAFARWVFKKYMRSATDAESILKELKV